MGTQAASSSEQCPPPPKFDPNSIKISVDLVYAAHRELAFLRKVDSYPALYEGPVVKNALRRYELFWLPLAAEHDNLAAPLDIHWVWHCHMLAPLYYEKDCLRVVYKVVDHKILTENSRAAAVQHARKLWQEKYKHEPFEVPMDDNSNLVSGIDNFQTKLKYNLEVAISRQKMFYCQVSLPHYQHSLFIKAAITRYKKYLYLKKNNMDMFLVPCYDFDLVWHSHQLHPLLYKKDTVAVLGVMFNHDDSVNDRAPNSKLNRSDQSTRELWMKHFGEDFALCGAMYRGPSPYGKLQYINVDQVFSVSTKTADVTINSLKVENMDNDQRFTLKAGLGGPEQSGPCLLKLKGPQTEWENNSVKGITKFKFNTGHHSLLQFDLVDKKGFFYFGSNQS